MIGATNKLCSSKIKNIFNNKKKCGLWFEEPEQKAQKKLSAICKNKCAATKKNNYKKKPCGLNNQIKSA